MVTRCLHLLLRKKRACPAGALNHFLSSADVIVLVLYKYRKFATGQSGLSTTGFDSTVLKGYSLSTGITSCSIKYIFYRECRREDGGWWCWGSYESKKNIKGRKKTKGREKMKRRAPLKYFWTAEAAGTTLLSSRAHTVVCLALVKEGEK